MPKPKEKKSKSSTKSAKEAKQLGALCSHCESKITKGKKALYVEEDLSRVFCSEKCILDYFQPEINQMEKEYFALLKPFENVELTSVERERLLPLRWKTLKEPEEIWLEKSARGDTHYALIREFNMDGKPIWCVCVTLYLRGDPSFLFLAAVTRQREMVDHYRKSDLQKREKLKVLDVETELVEVSAAEQEESLLAGPGVDALADGWTDEDTLRAQAEGLRDNENLPQGTEEYKEKLLEETLEHPDEVWTLETKSPEGKKEKFYHFIRKIRHMNGEGWFIIVAKDGKNDDEIEIMEAFATKKPEIVQGFRQGVQEINNRNYSDGGATGTVH